MMFSHSANCSSFCNNEFTSFHSIQAPSLFYFTTLSRVSEVFYLLQNIKASILELIQPPTTKCKYLPETSTILLFPCSKQKTLFLRSCLGLPIFYTFLHSLTHCNPNYWIESDRVTSMKLFWLKNVGDLNVLSDLISQRCDPLFHNTHLIVFYLHFFTTQLCLLHPFPPLQNLCIFSTSQYFSFSAPPPHMISFISRTSVSIHQDFCSEL